MINKYMRCFQMQNMMAEWNTLTYYPHLSSRRRTRMMCAQCWCHLRSDFKLPGERFRVSRCRSWSVQTKNKAETSTGSTSLCLQFFFCSDTSWVTSFLLQVPLHPGKSIAQELGLVRLEHLLLSVPFLLPHIALKLSFMALTSASVP